MAHICYFQEGIIINKKILSQISMIFGCWFAVRGIPEQSLLYVWGVFVDFQHNGSIASSALCILIECGVVTDLNEARHALI